jgi:hypothetical protein
MLINTLGSAITRRSLTASMVFFVESIDVIQELKTMDDELRKYRRTAREQGWHERPTKKGFQLIPPAPEKEPVQVHGTPSDHRALRNLLSDLRRNGLVWPPPR